MIFDSVYHFCNVTNTTNILIMQLINRIQIIYTESKNQATGPEFRILENTVP